MRSFDDDLLKYKKSEIAKEWLWVPCEDESYRYILGTKGLNPLIVIGINPSLAKANKLDNTMKRVKKIVYNNDFDSYIMLNDYARRKTKINELECELDINLHQENLKAFSYVFETVKKPITIWAAWGIHIYKRLF
ncbi:MAG: DUF1643 domain-containing protein [Campylobacter sp.]|nr:DUF1643 domain-containing protein [Campylobacter sp.]